MIICLKKDSKGLVIRSCKFYSVVVERLEKLIENIDAIYPFADDFKMQLSVLRLQML